MRVWGIYYTTHSGTLIRLVTPFKSVFGVSQNGDDELKRGIRRNHLHRDCSFFITNNSTPLNQHHYNYYSIPSTQLPVYHRLLPTCTVSYLIALSQIPNEINYNVPTYHETIHHTRSCQPRRCSHATSQGNEVLFLFIHFDFFLHLLPST